MRNKRLQSQVTAGRWTLPAVIFYLRPMLGVDLLFISRFHSLNRTRRQPFCLATRPRFSASGMGRPDCQLPDLCNHRLLSDRAEQSVQHYPYEGFHADGYLFPAGHRLPENAFPIYRRYCCPGLSHFHLFSV